MRKFSVASSAKMKGYKAERVSVTAKNPLDAVYEGHPQLHEEVIQDVRFHSKNSNIKASYFEVDTPSGTHKVVVEELD